MTLIADAANGHEWTIHISDLKERIHELVSRVFPLQTQRHLPLVHDLLVVCRNEPFSSLAGRRWLDKFAIASDVFLARIVIPRSGIRCHRSDELLEFLIIEFKRWHGCCNL
jgi:hypothetical protein